MDDSEPRPRTPTDLTTTPGTSRPNPLIPIRLEVSQNSNSKKEEPSVATDEPASTDHRGGIPGETPATSTPSGLPIPMISISDSESDQQNTSPKDLLVITINDRSLRSSGDHRAEFEDAPDVVSVRSSDSTITGTPKVIALEDESTDLESEPEVTPCHVAVTRKEEATTSSASASEEDLVEGMSNLFSEQEKVLAIQRGTTNGLRSGRNYKFNYDKRSASTPATSSSVSLSLVIPTWENQNTNDVDPVNASVNERPIEPLKYHPVEHLKCIPAQLHILDLLQMSKETRDNFI